MKYSEYKQPLNYADVGTDILNWWQENGIFEKSVSTREGQPTFVFYEGPPSANGAPGIHHVMARTVKDIFCRYQTLLGKQVSRKGGWDTHGLPIELQVEKELGITKEDIGKKISIAEYNQRCRETVMRFKAQWDDLTQKMGYWVDLDDPYITFEPEYIESCWALLKKLYDKGLLYKGYTIQPYSPAAGTGLSSHELNQPGTYRDVKDTTIVAQFKVKRDETSEKLFAAPVWERQGTDSQTDVFILAWTTTPWTLAANTGLAVGKNISYVVVRTINPYTKEYIRVVLAKARVKSYFSEFTEIGKSIPSTYSDWGSETKQIPWEIEAEFTGADLVGINYERLFGQSKGFPAFEGEEKGFRVVAGDFVTTEDGTGIVHISPTFGADDFRVAQLNDIPALLVTDAEGKPTPIVDRTGRYVPQMGEFGGRLVKNYDGHDETGTDYKTLDESIAIRMKGDGTAFKVEKYEHTYPHCWRTDKPVLYYPLDSWFIKTTAVKDRLIELNKTINWKPESTGSGRFGNWLENLVDWNLSRSRYWGTPLPIWRSQDGSEEICIGSIAQLSAEIDKAVAAEIMTHNPLTAGGQIDLHRPYVDDIFLVSPTGQAMYRETDLIDVWFDSGAMPYAQWHYPLENEAKFQKNFPADFIAEGVDQTRGWFFTLHALGVMLEDSVAFKNVIANGLVLAKDGQKMSKRLGNAVDPFATIQQFGPDATRWYLIANAPPWDNLKFDPAGVTEVQRRFFGTLFNTYSFFALYANLDDFRTREFDRIPLTDLSELDRWVLSKLQSLILEVRGHYDSYDPTKAARAIQDFVTDQLSNWYVRLSRRRFWKGELTTDKKAAFETLQECLVVVAQLMAPIAPFFGEWLYKNMTDGMRQEALANNTPLAPESVHLTLLVEANTSRIDTALEERMELAQRISSLTHSLRKKSVLKVRQPLQRILVPVLNDTTRDQVGMVEDLICAEVNVKHVEFLDDTSGVLVKSVKPNFKRLGQQYGPKLKVVAARIQQMTPEEISTLESTGTLVVEIGGEQLNLAPDDVEIRTDDLPGWLVATDGPLTVALDVTLTDELRREGVARELVNRLQNLRKDSGLEVQDKIRITLGGEQPDLAAAVQFFGDYIRTETQALSLTFNPELTGGVTLEFDDYSVPAQLEVVTA
ncbi:isoleucine--tRNA ligase [Hymenobacter qilianensis]|uniref:Isoleucine--tRNA ligase n=2 Tax=Hymenobacter qilianensis TaxID=1385715 RepID=A0ACB5PNS9_9BACT|nr:isoleucine--tRNA ligase [Hymenobacter qilianensis]QNP53362.1 isoleucine--tRNA ligase [Hymenobacter qilianensis]GGF57232.1 isoleucine--tRNA ligase [Hymenobacter qilianensis]